MKTGDWVETPDGVGRIVGILRSEHQWARSRHHWETWYVVEFRNGKRHPWAASKIRLLDRPGAQHG